MRVTRKSFPRFEPSGSTAPRKARKLSKSRIARPLRWSGSMPDNPTSGALRRSPVGLCSAPSAIDHGKPSVQYMPCGDASRASVARRGAYSIIHAALSGLCSAPSAINHGKTSVHPEQRPTSPARSSGSDRSPRRRPACGRMRHQGKGWRSSRDGLSGVPAILPRVRRSV